jgi:hypothetical protein
MAERTILVCDICGRPAVQTVTFKVGRRSLQKDYCAAHLQELTVGARTPRPGRRRGAVVAPPAERRGRPPKSAASRAKRRGRPRKTQAAGTPSNG